MNDPFTLRDVFLRKKKLKFFFCCSCFLLLVPDFGVLPKVNTESLSLVLTISRLAVTYNLADDSVRVNALIKLSHDSIGSNVLLSESAARKALALSQKVAYDEGMIKSFLSIGAIYRIRAEFSGADSLIRAAISLSENIGDEIALAKCNLAMYKLLFVQGRYEAAREFNNLALATGKQTPDQKILAEAYGNEGVMLGISGKHIEATESFLKALAIYHAIENEQMAGLTLMSIGHTFELAGSYGEALDYLEQALEINKRLPNASITGWTLLNIGVTYSRINPEDHARSRGYYEQALAMAEKVNEVRLKLACMDNIGGSYSMSGDYKKANAWLKKAYELSKSAGHNSRTGFITGNLAENYLNIGQLDSAVLFGKENLRIAIQENNAFEKRESYSVLSRIYAARNENRAAYEMLLRHTKLTDSIFNVEKSQQIEDLREKYESEKKQQEIELLTKEKAAVVFRRNTFASLALLFLVLGFLVYLVLKMRVRKNRLLLEKEIDLDRMKSRFFANISHEFRTPLTLILGPIDEMLSRNEETAIQKYLKPMRKNASRLLDLVNQLLELSRIESGTLRPQLTRNNIVTLVKGIGMSFDSLAEMKNIQLNVLAESTLPEIYIDRDKFGKILANLLSNAFKFTPESGTISVLVRRTSETQLPGVSECFELLVKDSGGGIPGEDLGHIFDRFYQADNNELRQQDGSGIGLALTKELVELHRGMIWAAADVQQGTEFRIQIPLNLEQILEDCIVEVPASVKGAEIHANHYNGTDFADSAEMENGPDTPVILLIEDHPDVRNYIRDTLEDTYQVIEASDGKEGIAIALEQIPDLILCDIMMPKMNGNQVCIHLKREEKTSHIPIILLTAKADIESRIEGLETKADDYLTKPFVPKELMLRIQNLIDSRQKLRDKYMQALTLRPNEVSVNSVDEKFLKRMMDLLEVHMGDEKLSVEALGAEIGMSRSQLHRKLKALTGQGPNQFIRIFRLNRAHDLLKVNAATAAEIAYTVGFSSPSYFTKCFHEQFGYTPTEIGNH